MYSSLVIVLFSRAMEGEKICSEQGENEFL